MGKRLLSRGAARTVDAAYARGGTTAYGGRVRPLQFRVGARYAWPDLNQRTGEFGLRIAPEIHVGGLVHAGHGAARRAAFGGLVLAADVFHGVFEQRLGRVAALLR